MCCLPVHGTMLKIDDKPLVIRFGVPMKPLVAFNVVAGAAVPIWMISLVTLGELSLRTLGRRHHDMIFDIDRCDFSYVGLGLINFWEDIG